MKRYREAMADNRSRRVVALLRYEPRCLDGLSWRLIGFTALVAVLLALPSEPLLEAGWAAPVWFGMPLGVASWLRVSAPWFAFSVIVGLNVVLLATVLSNLWHSPLGRPGSLALAIVAGSLLACAIFALEGAPFRRGSVPWYELTIALLTWGFAAATWYALAHARLITWKGLALLFLFALVNHVRSVFAWTGPEDELVLSTLVGTLIHAARALPIVLGVVAAVNRFPDPGRRQYQGLAMAVVLGAAIGTLFFHVLVNKGIFIDYSHPHPFVHLAKLLQSSFLRLAIPGALFAIVYAYYRDESTAAAALQQTQADQTRLDTQMDEARLQVLQAQIEPHFLFNTLASVKRLYQTHPEVARRMLDNLIRYLTEALPQMRAADSTVEREAAVAEAYLEIQRIRMGPRLSFDISLPTKLRGARLPPMMLLTLVENAVKHGLSPLPEGGFIQIGANANSGFLEVKVADTGRGFTRTSGAGTGLANVRARLTALYGNAGRLSLEPNAPRGVTASIAVPLSIAAAQAGPQ